MRTRPGGEAGDDRAVEQLPRRPEPDHGAERVDQAGAIGGGHEYILTERMEATPISPGTSTAPPARRLLARLAAIALVAVSIPLAAPEGPDFVVGGGRSDPGWLYGPLGVFGAGFVDRPMVYLCLLWLAIAIWIVLLVLARDLGMRWTAAVTGLLIVLFVLAPPLLSLDVFSYISYARLGAEHGLNPYEFAPSALPPSDEAARQVLDYRDAVSVYGPLFTLGSYPLGALGVPFALWSLKAIAGAAIAVVVALVARLARLRGIEPAAAVAFVGLNPIVLVHLVGGAHNDGLTAAIAMAAARRRPERPPGARRERLRRRRGGQGLGPALRAVRAPRHPRARR